MMIGTAGGPLGAIGERVLQVRIVELGDMRVLMGEAHLGGGIQAPEHVAALARRLDPVRIMGLPPPPTQPPGQAMTSTKIRMRPPLSAGPR